MREESYAILGGRMVDVKLLDTCVPEIVVKYGNLLDAALRVFDRDVSGHYLKDVSCPCSICNLWRVVQSQIGGR